MFSPLCIPVHYEYYCYKTLCLYRLSVVLFTMCMYHWYICVCVCAWLIICVVMCMCGDVHVVMCMCGDVHVVMGIYDCVFVCGCLHVWWPLYMHGWVHARL